ncbi:toll/interleukin-1 receptor domain-containing protein [Vibrio kanaloae]|uniref:toll/interleukin-1 receptor domain-containing protein n=1 Tax=Vibrio kanaloae TaxID=170673 RepID=UPI00098972D9|nr:toll/interleukin-1 receptor domain-containing protein [Vibrio kanaloae]QPK06487.1 toll/interleukin-1 receptor domain-containing protein [Vibrio kanaloae]
MSAIVPSVFISYSHDDQPHKKWVLELAQRLRNSGVDAILDQFKLGLGDDLSGFMERSVEDADRIIMICTDNYVTKANEGLGGVGYEKMIMTSEYMSRIDSNKVIPLIRQKGTRNVPTFLKTRMNINFSQEDEFELMFDELLREIHQAPLFKEPPVGNNPFESVIQKPAESVADKKSELLKIMVDEFNSGLTYFTFNDIHQLIDSSRLFAEVYIGELQEEGFILKGHEPYIGEHFILTTKAKRHAINLGWVTE